MAQNYSAMNTSPWKSRSQTFFSSSTCGSFITSSTADGSAKVTKPNPLYQEDHKKNPPSFSCTLHIFQTYNYELLREAYLERFVVGSFMTKHSFNSPYLLKYSLNPSEKMESKTTSLRQWRRKICFALIGRAAVTRDSSQQTKQ